LSTAVFPAIVAMAIFRFFGLFTEPALSAERIHQITTGSAAPAAAPAVPGDLKIVTWNIERGVRLPAIAATLKELQADVVLLQEVDRFADRSGNRDIALELGTALGMHWATVGEFQEIGEGGRGRGATSSQAILSRFPILNPHAIVFARQKLWRWRLNPMQPRRGGRVAIRAETAGVTFYNLHLESGDADDVRREQLEEVMRLHGAAPAPVTVLGGDLNTGERARAGLLQRMDDAGFVDALGPVGSRRTSSKYRQPVDWIFVRGARPVAGRVELREGISDHYPLVSTVSVHTP
jgi:endonuclease/exonuclease/phosphatase family metal-dependent hydrolase